MNTKEWKEKNRDKTREYARKHTRKIRNALIELFGSKCAKCGFSDIRALQIDHLIIKKGEK